MANASSKTSRKIPAKKSAPTRKKPAKKSAAPATVQVISSKLVHQSRVFSLTSDEIVEPSGVRVRRDIIRHPGSVVILALDERKPEPSVLLIRQYRYAANQELWEIPAGRIDEGEDPLTAAKRELAEETGYSASEWKLALTTTQALACSMKPCPCLPRATCARAKQLPKKTSSSSAIRPTRQSRAVGDERKNPRRQGHRGSALGGAEVSHLRQRQS